METFLGLREENIDGTSVIVELKDDIYLTVNPPKGSGKRVTIEAIKRQLIDKRVTSPIDFEIVKQAIEMCSEASPTPKGSQGSPTTSSYGTGYPIKISSVDGERVEFKEIPAPTERGERKEKEQTPRIDAVARSCEVRSKAITPTEYRDSFKMVKNIKRAIGIGGVDITISEDKMEAYITVHSLPKKSKATYIIEKLMKKSVIYGIDKKKIFKVIRNNLFQQRVLVARGKAPKEGKNAELIFKFGLRPVDLEGINREKGAKIEHSGNIDYYYLDSAPHVKKNEVLVEKKPPVPAEMGINVKGYKIKPCDLRGVARNEAKQSVPRNKPGGQDVLMPAGKNTVISEDGAKLLAAIDGYLTFSDGKFNIDRNCMVVKGDVDASIGKVYFQGNVFITGTVFEGFTVEADGDIEIQGYVHKASLNSKDGSVIIRKGAYKSNVEANGDIRIEMADESVIYAKGNVLIDEDLLNCLVTGEKKVFVDGEKGIVGGKVCAGMEIIANNIGSPDHVKTTVQIVEEDSQLFLLEGKMKDTVEKLSSLGQKLTTNSPKELLLPMIEKYVAQKKRVSQLKEEHLQLLKTKLKDSSEDSAPSLKANKTIRVYDTIYDGVEIQIGEAKLRIKEEEHGTVLTNANPPTPFEERGKVGFRFFRDGNYINFESKEAHKH